MQIVVSNERWITLASHAGAFSASRFGYTPTDETDTWPARKMREHLIYFCTHGGFRVAFDDHIAVVNRGTFLWMMPWVQNETRLLAPRSTFRTYYLRFQLQTEEGVSARLEEDHLQKDEAWELLPLLQELVGELQSPQPFHDQRVRATLVLLSAKVLNPTAMAGNAVLTTQQRLRLVRYIEGHGADKVSPQDLANEMGLSMPYFRRIFHRSFGMSPKHWIVRQRIMAAALMLSGTEMRIKEVAYRLGYCDEYLFSRQFKEVLGVSPTLYRRGRGTEPAWQHRADDMNASQVLRSAMANNKDPRNLFPSERAV